MSRTTIGKHWPRSAPKGDHTVRCDYCGVAWRRSQCVRDGAGLLVCPDDQGGKDAVTLAKGNAAAAQRYRGPQVLWDTGPSDPKQEGASVHATTAEDIYAS